MPFASEFFALFKPGLLLTLQNFGNFAIRALLEPLFAPKSSPDFAL